MSTHLNGLNRRIERIEQVIEALVPAPGDVHLIGIPDNGRDGYLAPGEQCKQFGSVIIYTTSSEEGTGYE